MKSFESFMEAATSGEDCPGKRPYPYQALIAERGLPELLWVETGAGKTAGVVLPWLWRRFCHDDLTVRANTPRWLVICEPMRTLTEQVFENITGWVRNLEGEGLLERNALTVHTLMGGGERSEQGKKQMEWRSNPERPAVVVGTLDMLLSRALNRGFAMSRYLWPIDFGLFNNGVHWVFDEVQLMGPALSTTLQLEAFRREFGTVLASSSTWMSATVDPAAMRTVDFPPINSAQTVRLGELDRKDESLSSRLAATKQVTQLEIDDKRRVEQIAGALVDRHRLGTLTLGVLNTVLDAQAVYREVCKLGTPAEVVLLHSRFRPSDRLEHTNLALSSPDPSGPGRIVVSTQVVEAGVDISATTLLTEVAPWPSIVQRAGRCNRDGIAQDAQLLWVAPKDKDPGPYNADDLERAKNELEALEGRELTSTVMGERDVRLEKVVSPVIRRIDLLGLFDTAPDMSGNDIDISPYIRDGDDLNVYFAWTESRGAPLQKDWQPGVDELCPVPLNKKTRAFIKDKGAQRFDHIDGEWSRVKESELRPGMILVVDADSGGYDPEIGLDLGSKKKVQVRDAPEPAVDLVNRLETEDAMGSDSLSTVPGAWVPLEMHLGDVKRCISEIAKGFGPGIPQGFLEAAETAGEDHDIGKAHNVFQDSILSCADEGDRGRRAAGKPWAKSGSDKRLRHKRRYFRHELASALMLLGEGSVVLRGKQEQDLILYLVAAHHGRVRLGIRSMEGEESTVLGIEEGESVPAVTTPNGEIPPTTLSLETMILGRADSGEPSWSQRMAALLGREDLGPFRLGFLEALVRLGDWRASVEEEQK
ncbi:MAG: CRISPR-associated endonuclease Cas3'' [Actinobacteria bacterium]|nr:CRISPR-associated endonuclease Cas3'' [Actinomycetota bacterium]